jgi:hypothetical protein
LLYAQIKRDSTGKPSPCSKESAEKQAENPTVHYHLGMAYYKVGDTQLAKGASQRACNCAKIFRGPKKRRRSLHNSPEGWLVKVL